MRGGAECARYDISKTSLLYRLSLICFWHLRTLSKNRTNEQKCARRAPGEIKTSRDLRGGKWSWTLTVFCPEEIMSREVELG